MTTKWRPISTESLKKKKRALNPDVSSIAGISSCKKIIILCVESNINFINPFRSQIRRFSSDKNGAHTTWLTHSACTQWSQQACSDQGWWVTLSQFTRIPYKYLPPLLSTFELQSVNMSSHGQNKFLANIHGWLGVSLQKYGNCGVEVRGRGEVRAGEAGHGYVWSEEELGNEQWYLIRTNVLPYLSLKEKDTFLTEILHHQVGAPTLQSFMLIFPSIFK